MIKTIKEAKAKGFYTKTFENGDWTYEDREGFQHVIRGRIELTKGIKTYFVSMNYNGDWFYVDTKGNTIKIKQGEDLRFENIILNNIVDILCNTLYEIDSICKIGNPNELIKRICKNTLDRVQIDKDILNKLK